MPELTKSRGFAYLQETKHERHAIFHRLRPAIEPGKPYKEYPGRETIALTPNFEGKEHDLWQTLQHRRSIRKYAREELDLIDLSLLLWACQGITARAGNYLLRCAPSAGALYPIETYVGIERVGGAEPGIFHYNVRQNKLERLTSGPPGRQIAAAALDQSFIDKAAVVFLWSAVLRRNMSKYGHRGLRYIFLDAGHICQNLLLAAQALGFGACPVAAFYDDECNDLLSLDGLEESVIYMAPVGPIG